MSARGGQGREGCSELMEARGVIVCVGGVIKRVSALSISRWGGKSVYYCLLMSFVFIQTVSTFMSSSL